MVEKRVKEIGARELLARMSLAEKIHQMSGDTPYLPGMLEMAREYNSRPLPAGGNARLGIPPLLFTDGPRGVAVGRSTCFPVTMARGAAWDRDLEERIGDAIGVEARSQGANFFAGVCINLLRHPAWGRAQETYGEDPHHLGELGAALVRGVQRHVMACVKHYAINSMENARFQVDVQVGEKTLREVYLPHFKRCVDAGAASVMTAYNKVNGHYCGQQQHLIRDILKGEWGFDGFTLSDFIFGTRGTVAAARAGLDVEMPFTWHYGKRLERAVEAGSVPLAAIDEAVVRILGQKQRFSIIGEPGRYGIRAVACPKHRALAREAAEKSVVLLKNDPPRGRRSALLPLEARDLRRLAVIGRLAREENIGDRGSSLVRAPEVVTLLQGLGEAAAGRFEILFDDGMDLDKAARTAARADVALVTAGNTYRQEGEYIPVLGFGGDRERLTLRHNDETLIRAVAASNASTLVVLMGGGPFITEAWRRDVPAILMAWYPGMEGGRALADIILGKVNPSGKLPCVFPRKEAHLPYFDRKARQITYGYYHGYSLMDRYGIAPAFPFGHGLGYSTFSYGKLRLNKERVGPMERLEVIVEVTNRGRRGGEEVVQLYAGREWRGRTGRGRGGFPGTGGGREGSLVLGPVKLLKGFERVQLEPGASKRVVFNLPMRALAAYDTWKGRWCVEKGAYNIYVGASSSAKALLTRPFELRE